MIAAMSKAKYNEVKERMERWSVPTCCLRMANREVVPSIAHWEGDITIGDTRGTAALEVFDSKGSWDILIGKPIMEAF